MIKRSDIRYALYLKKKDLEADQALLALVEPKIPAGESWKTFSVKWDILLNKNNEVMVISPEVDYNYIHSICLEISLCKRKDIELDLDDRASNVMQIVELNMLGNMKWEDYNKTWGVFVDYELKRIHTKYFKTNQNVVTDAMIQASRPSDGAEMKEVPSIPVHAIEMEPFEPSPAERAMIEAALGKKRK